MVDRVQRELDANTKVILHGGGGVGKSTLAYQAAAGFARDKRVGLAWVNATGQESLSVGQFVELLAPRLGSPENRPRSIGEVCARL